MFTKWHQNYQFRCFIQLNQYQCVKTLGPLFLIQWNILPIEIYKMLKTQLLTKIDTCLKSYVNENNSRYKRSINTIFMDRAQLKNFYHDMQGEKQSEKMEQLEKKGLKLNDKKSKSCFIKGNKILDWRNFDKVQINQKPLISNFSKFKRQNSGIKRESIRTKENNLFLQIPQENGKLQPTSQMPLQQVFQFFCPSEQASQCLPSDQVPTPSFTPNFALAENNQFDIQEIELIRKQQQQKCINKYRLKLGKKQFKPNQEVRYEQNLDASELEKSKNEEKINRKLTVCFQNFVESMENDIFREGNKEIEGVRKELKRKDEISNAIRAYFIKNNRDFKMRSKSKENSLYQKFIQGKQQIKTEFKSHFSRKNKNILII